LKKKSMKKILPFFIVIFVLFHVMSSKAQNYTDANMSFNVSTVSIGGNYSPRHVLAIWIKDSEGNFVISRKVLAASRKQHLVKWVSSSGNNSVSAVTGPTINNHTSHTVNWDCRDLSGNLVPDGTYQVWMEYTSRNSASDGVPGPSAHISFTKGTDELNQTFPDETYFKQMSLTYSPIGVALDETGENIFDIRLGPVPFTNEVNLSFVLPESSFVSINMYDAQGRRIKELVDDYLTPGIHVKTYNTVDICQNELVMIRFSINGRLVIRKLSCL
jgi:hypothetical protein